MLYQSEYLSPLGKIILTSEGNNLTGLWFAGGREPKWATTDASSGKDVTVFTQTREWLDIYFSGREPGFTPPVAWQDSAFRNLVWDLLLQIPYGQTVAYGDLAVQAAAMLGKKKMAAQAIGGAVGANPICLIVPCHRVVGKNGSLTGYGGGLDKKIALLKLEKVDLKKFFLP